MGSASSALTRLHSTQVIAAILHELEVSLAGSWIGDLSVPIQSDKELETYIDLGAVPRMKEWLGKRPVQELREIYFQIRNRKFAVGLQVMVDDLRRDNFGKIQPRISELGKTANGDHWEELFSQLIVDAESTACYDGQYFFDTDHSEGSSGTQDNDITVDISAMPVATHGVITAPSDAEMAISITKGIKQLYGFKDDQGRPINGGAQRFKVMVPVGLMDAALAALNLQTFQSGAVNPLKGSGWGIDLVVNPWLYALSSSWTDRFVVFRADGMRKPFIKQEELAPQVQAKAEGSEYEFDNDAHQYGVKAVRGCGYNDWKGACLVTMI